VLALELFVERGEAQVDGDELALIVVGGDPGEQHLGELLEAAAGLVDAGELGEHEGLVGADAAGREQGGEGVFGAAEALVGLGDLQERGGGAGALTLGLGGEGGELFVDGALALGDALDGGEQLRVAAVDGEGLAEGLRGGGQILQAVFEKQAGRGEVVRARRRR
jgi:hypothetical protein